MDVARATTPPSDGEAKPEVKRDDHRSKPALTPPTSEGTKGHNDDSGSELSDVELDEQEKTQIKQEETPRSLDDEEIKPDHYFDGGKIPVFKPTMDQFRSFKDFVRKIDKYGMKSGIVKVVPPKEWRDSLPALDEQVKTIRVKNPISQEFHGSHGTYTQANMEKQRSYNLPQWRALCEESNHQPPARRGERRKNLAKPKPTTPSKAKQSEDGPGQTIGKRKRNGRGATAETVMDSVEDVPKESVEEEENEGVAEAPPTPTSPAPKRRGRKPKAKPKTKSKPQPKPKDKAQRKEGEETKSGGRQPKSIGSRRLHNKQDQVNYVDEEAFEDFDYRLHGQEEWTIERMQELETAYWRSLNFNNPMYGADMPGSLFDDSTASWNVAKLENLLDVLGQKVPGVNTAYLYLGMWKATFAWHLEDVDLYSINYIHFGAPKQWYSISQEDARRFESAMKSVWTSDAKNCDQFLRHKTYLISPQHLQSQFNIKVNRLVHYEGEFVITFPYGYHSGYNLGYNCAESVNFATESWLDYGKVARKCNCEAENVWVDVREIERKLRGEPTPEYYEETEDDDDDEDEELSHLPTPPGSVKGKGRSRQSKKKKGVNEKEGKKKVKKLKIRLKAPAHEPCVLCPFDYKYEELLPTDTGERAHRRCGLYTPETYVSEEPDGSSMVRDIAMIDKARLNLKCNYCRNRKGAVFQCSSKKCTKAYHATCAMPAGIQIDIGPTSVYGEDGTEYIDTGFDFRCRIHRSKRHKNLDSFSLENSEFVYTKAKKLALGDSVQAQFYQGDIFAGHVLENRKDEQTVLLDVLPKGDKVEVEWKWLLFFDPVNSQLPVPSETAKPLPADMLRKSRTTADHPAAQVDCPKANEPFCDPQSIHVWSEFETRKPFVNEFQVKVDLDKPDMLWYYIAEQSTDARCFFTHDPAIRESNSKANFLEVERLKELAESMKKIKAEKPPITYRPVNQHAVNAVSANYRNGTASTKDTPSQSTALSNKERPYTGKYAISDPVPLQWQRSSYTSVTPSPSHTLTFQQQTPKNFAKSFRPYSFGQYNPAFPIPSYNKAPAVSRTVAPSKDSQSSPKPAPTKGQQPPAFNANSLLRKVNLESGKASSTSESESAAENDDKPATPQRAASSALSEGSTSPTLSREPSTSGRNDGSSVQGSKGISRLKLDAKYVYLHEAERARPQIPLTRPRGLSMSEQYLKARSASEQGIVSQKMTEERMKLLLQQNAALQRSQDPSQPKQQGDTALPAIPPSTHSHAHPLSHATASTKRPHQPSPLGLQHQSASDIHSISAHAHPQRDSTAQTASSPLRDEFGAVGETMLPLMEP